MRKLVTWAALLFATSAWTASAVADDEFTGALSNKTYEVWVSVNGDDLTCQITSSDAGYVPVEWALAVLKLDRLDRNQVLQHESVKAQAVGQNGSGSAQNLCADVATVKQQADDQGYIRAEKTSEVQVLIKPVYGLGCVRVLEELVTIRLSDELVLKGQSERILSGDYTDEVCWR